MKLKNIFKLGGALIAMSGLMAGIGRAESVTLVYSRWLPANYAMDRDVVIPWLKQIEEVTEGRVKVEITPKGVGTVAGQYDVVADGLADVSFVVTGYTPGRFPLAEGLELPFLGDNPLERCENYWEAYENFLKPAKVFEEVVILGIICTGASHFTMTNKIINSIDDFRGSKIRTPSIVVSKIIEALDAVPVSKPTPEIYELASGGVIDGAVFSIDPIPAFNLEQVLKKITYIPGGLSGTVTILPVNKAKWDRISSEDQQAIIAISGAKLATAAGVLVEKETALATEQIKAAGGEIVIANEELVSEMKRRVAFLRDEWIAKAEEAGLADPEGMLAIFR